MMNNRTESVARRTQTRLRRTLGVCAVLALMPLGAVAEDLAKFANGEVITEQDFTTYLNRRADLKPLARNFWGAENALREMAMTRALVLEGERTGVERRSADKTQRFDDPYGQAVYKKLAKTCVKPADAAAAKKFYDAHPDVFMAPASARLARVMLPASEKVDGETALAWLTTQAMAVAKGDKRFDEVAERAAKLYKMEPQGDLGWVNLTDDISVMRALAGARKGEMVGPVRDGDFGYLFLVMEKREARQLKWSEVETQAATRAFGYCREQANKELTDKLFKQYGVTISEPAIKALFKIPVSPKPSASAAVAASAPKAAAKK